jgi:hypothetical protein
MTVTEDQRGTSRGPVSAQAAVEQMLDAGLLDEVMRRWTPVRWR